MSGQSQHLGKGLGGLRALQADAPLQVRQVVVIDLHGLGHVAAFHQVDDQHVLAVFAGGVAGRCVQRHDEGAPRDQFGQVAVLDGVARLFA
ncbi:hypothetical protein G6F59_018930 [Rhizopus arrhizus]|nr:hypothetical protein G6F59_018930 [Rhizopus arrhizus]